MVLHAHQGWTLLTIDVNMLVTNRESIMKRESEAKATKYKARSGANRRSRGFLQTGGLLTNRIRGASERRGFAETRLLTHWAEIVGQSIATIARPIKVSYAREGFGATLTILASGAHAPELQMLLPKLQEKVNACYGYNAISRVRITQTTEHGFAESTSGFRHETAKPLKPISTQQSNTLKSSIEPIGDAGLRAALEKLGNNVLSKH